MPENVTPRRDPDGEARRVGAPDVIPWVSYMGIVGAPGGLAERAFGVDGSNRKEITDGVARVCLEWLWFWAKLSAKGENLSNWTLY